MIRNVFNLPFRTHRCLIEPVSCTPHLFTRLTNRFMKFYHSIYSSDKCVINNLRCVQQNDLRSTFGLNIHNMCRTTNTIDPNNLPRNNIHYFKIQDHETWRSDLILGILKIRSNELTLDFNRDDLTTMLEFAACSDLVFT